MKKILLGAAVVLSTILPAFAQDAVGIPGTPGFVLPAACAPAALNAGGAAPCLALFAALDAVQARALRAAVRAANGGQDVAVLLSALQESGLAAGDDASPVV